MFFSIITPCFNSSKTLLKTFESLKKQVNRNFEWILVDDHSSDEGQTRRIILNIKEKAEFNVKVIFLDENYFGSKSVYSAALIAEGDYICILDHDDLLIDTAIADVHYLINKYEAKRDVLAGVVGRCLNEKGELIGPEFPENDFIATEGDVRFKMKFPYELIQFTAKNLVIKHFKDHKPGYTNGYSWAMISVTKNWIYTNKRLRVYDTALETSFSNSYKKKITFPSHRFEAILRTFETFDDYLIYNPLYGIKVAASAIRYGFHGKERIFCSAPRNILSKLFYFLACPVGFAKYLIEFFTHVKVFDVEINNDKQKE